MTLPQRARYIWWGLLAATSGVLILAFLPPVLSAEFQAAVRASFASVCHQIPSRSPHIGGVPIAICDRCTGIYVGLVIGVIGTGWGRGLWQRLGSHGRFLLLGSLIPLGVDWIGPILGVWSNVPISRASTGFVFGSIAASFVTDRLLRKVARTDPVEGSE